MRVCRTQYIWDPSDRKLLFAELVCDMLVMEGGAPANVAGGASIHADETAQKPPAHLGFKHPAGPAKRLGPRPAATRAGRRSAGRGSGPRPGPSRPGPAPRGWQRGGPRRCRRPQRAAGTGGLLPQGPRATRGVGDPAALRLSLSLSLASSRRQEAARPAPLAGLPAAVGVGRYCFCIFPGLVRRTRRRHGSDNNYIAP